MGSEQSGLLSRGVRQRAGVGERGGQRERPGGLLGVRMPQRWAPSWVRAGLHYKSPAPAQCLAPLGSTGSLVTGPNLRRARYRRQEPVHFFLPLSRGK